MARALGLDFGTTNSVLALADSAGTTHSLPFTSPAGTTDVITHPLATGPKA